jgi:hypothetical protein
MNALTVTVTVKENALYDVVQMAIDTLQDEFGCDVTEAAGVDEQELFDAILKDKTFREMIVNGIKEDGTDFVQNPYDYIDGYDFLETIPGLIRVVKLCREMDDIIRDAKKEPEVTCVPVPAGYKLVKI